MRPSSPTLLVATALLVTLTAAPLAAATLGASTPPAAACVLQDTDACQALWASPVGAYFLSFTGSFAGTAIISVTSIASPSIQFTQSCSGTLVGVVMTAGGCSMVGDFPTGEMRMDCSTSGAGAITCSVAGQ